MASYQHRLPTDVERLALGGPKFRTNVLALVSGHEKRNIEWSRVRGEWDLAGRFMNLEEVAGSALTDLHAIRDLFMVQQGRAHDFRFKDHADFEIGDWQDPTADNQQIGLGDDGTTAFQAFKRYTFGAVTYDRNIVRLVSGRVVVLLDGVVQNDPADYSVDPDSGIVTFVSAPASTGGTGPGGEEVVQVALEFDVPVRFATDHLQISLEPGDIGPVPAIPIVEIRQA